MASKTISLSRFTPELQRLFELEQPVFAPLERLSQWSHGHGWTIGPYLLNRFRPPSAGAGLAFEGQVEDALRGSVPLVGRLHTDETPASTLVVLLHGIGSDPDAGYVMAMTRSLIDAGFDALRLSLRGATGVGSDHYHAGQTADLHALLTHPGLDQYGRIFVVGFSLGGHIALRLAIEAVDPRWCGVVSICPPLSLDTCQQTLDGPWVSAYRANIISSLKEKYRRLTENGIREGRPVAISLEVLDSIRTIHRWDQAVVVPRFGFGTVENYYRTVSVGPRLDALKLPSLLIVARHDPMVPYSGLFQYLEHADARCESRVVERGGHLGFPGDLDLGFGGALGLEAQVTGWIMQRSEPGVRTGA